MKTKTKTSRIYRKRGVSALKKVNVVVSVSRVEGSSDGVFTPLMKTGSRAFVACAAFKTGGYVKLMRNYEPSKMHGMCSYGKNPRAAIASAMRKAAKHVTGRRGAFSRYK